MKKLLLSSIAFVFLLTSCGSKQKGELTGVQGKKMVSGKTIWNGTYPKGFFHNG